MWPWEHAIVGYVVFSLFNHLVYRAAPTGREALVVVFASVLPDLIDKPLAWQFDVFPAGYALAHSILFAVPLSIAVGVLARRYGRSAVGGSFGIGYLLHLPSDLLAPYVRTGEIATERVLWPVVVADPGGHPHASLFDGFVHNVAPYLAEIVNLDPSPYLLAQLPLVVVAVLLWVYDGMPGPRALGGGLRWSYETVARRLNVK